MDIAQTYMQIETFLLVKKKNLKIFIKKINVIPNLSTSATSVLLKHHTNK